MVVCCYYGYGDIEKSWDSDFICVNCFCPVITWRLDNSLRLSIGEFVNLAEIGNGNDATVDERQALNFFPGAIQ